MLASKIFSASDATVIDRLILAAITVGIGLLVWLVLHYGIRIVVKRAMAERAPRNNLTLRWAAPMLRNIDPVIRALDGQRRVQRARTIGSLLNSVLTIVVAVVTGFYVLIAFEINIAPLLASVGVVGIAIGFGCQQLIRDFLAGIFITIEDQYGIGDVIETSDIVGTVEYVGLRITRLVADDGTLWYLRNGEILRLGNRSKGHYRAPGEDHEATATTQPPTPAAPPAATAQLGSAQPGSAQPADPTPPASASAE